MATRAPTWTAEHDAKLKSLAERGYSVTRASIVMRRSTFFLAARAKALEIELKKPQRLPFGERTMLSVGRAHGQQKRSRGD
jgi:hypothetical protein